MPEIQSFLKPFDFGKQAREGQEFISGFAGAIPSIRGRTEAELGLPELRQRQQRGAELIGGLQTQLFDLPAQVQATTGQSLVTAPQLSRLQQVQAQPLLESLGRLSTTQAPLESALARTEEIAGQRVSESLLPFQLGFNLLEQQQARQFSGYTTANQLELNRLIANQDFGLRTQELAIKEQGFKNQLEQIRLTGEEERKTKKAPADLGTLFKSIFG
ncbi:MAG TPA: hypothetical protein ENI23_09020 [bacterium]|nr:hypothetical protein [bacterium]